VFLFQRKILMYYSYCCYVCIMFTARIFTDNDHVTILLHAAGPEESRQERSRDVCPVTQTSGLCDGCVLLQAETRRCIPLTASSRVSVQTSLDTLEETKHRFAQLSPIAHGEIGSLIISVNLFSAHRHYFDVTSLIIVISVVESIIL